MSNLIVQYLTRVFLLRTEMTADEKLLSSEFDNECRVQVEANEALILTKKEKLIICKITTSKSFVTTIKKVC
jgi:hypothetical protein